MAQAPRQAGEEVAERHLVLWRGTVGQVQRTGRGWLGLASVSRFVRREQSGMRN